MKKAGEKVNKNNYRIVTASHHKARDIKGMRFGKLIACEPTNLRSNGGVVWWCKCDCGGETLVAEGNLQSGGTKSCSCLTRHKTKRSWNSACKERLSCSLSLMASEKVIANPIDIEYEQCAFNCLTRRNHEFNKARIK